jgi:hypothetical protein
MASTNAERGVTAKSSPPIAPRSHLIAENKILRMLERGVVAGKKCRVRSIASWNDRSDLYRADVKEGELLIYSSGWTHGIAHHDQDDHTRVALELRLCRRAAA